MLGASSFDLWQKDAFFSAAEEVQHSADIMESAYRSWLRAKKEGLIPQHLDELERELQMAFGTAKWQLEEFEKAVRLSYISQSDDITAIRHRQFISAIEDHITRVETALKESFSANGKKPFRWVNLDEEECDDLARFLSGTPETSETVQDRDLKLATSITSSHGKSNNSKDSCSHGSEVTSKTQISNRGNCLEIAVENTNCYNELEERKPLEEGDIATSNRRTWSSPDRTTLEIVIDGVDMQKNTALIEATPKEKGTKPFFWRSRCEDHAGAKQRVLSHAQLRIISWINQHFRGPQRSQRQQLSPMLGVPSMRFILVLMLTIFLVVPFLVYAN